MTYTLRVRACMLGFVCVCRVIYSSKKNKQNTRKPYILLLQQLACSRPTGEKKGRKIMLCV